MKLDLRCFFVNDLFTSMLKVVDLDNKSNVFTNVVGLAFGWKVRQAGQLALWLSMGLCVS